MTGRRALCVWDMEPARCRHHALWLPLFETGQLWPHMVFDLAAVALAGTLHMWSFGFGVGDWKILLPLIFILADLF